MLFSQKQCSVTANHAVFFLVGSFVFLLGLHQLWWISVAGFYFLGNINGVLICKEGPRPVSALFFWQLLEKLTFLPDQIANWIPSDANVKRKKQKMLVCNVRNTFIWTQIVNWVLINRPNWNGTLENGTLLKHHFINLCGEKLFAH